MWGLLRSFLLVSNAAVCACLAYLTTVLRHAQFWFALGMLTLLALNFIYVLRGNGSGGRIFRLIGLWFDAKESELRQRADRSRQDPKP
jgi:hypothetical protein